MNDIEIITGLKKGLTKGFNILYSRYYDMVLFTCRKYVNDEHDAKDATQECFISAYQNINSFRYEGSLEGWLRRIARNTSINFNRRMHKVNNVNIDYVADIIPNLLPTFDSNIDYEYYMSFLNLLSTGYRTIFILHDIQGYKHKEIAIMLGISINTSKSQLARAKNKLQQLLIKEIAA